MRNLRTLGLLIAAIAVGLTPLVGRAEPLSALRLDQYLESLRLQAGIPGLSVGIVQDRMLVWERGFGQADVERAIPATADTPYPIAGLTSIISATVALQCVERGLIQLDQPVVQFFPGFAEPASTLRDVLQHVLPTGKFFYDLNRYDAVAAAIKSCTGKTLRSAIADEVLDRFAMTRSVPGHDFATWSPLTLVQFPEETTARYAAVMAEMARTYRANGRGKPIAVPFAPLVGLTGGSGLVSTVRDLARFQAALEEEGLLLKGDTRRIAWSISPDRPVPHGLGWFVQVYEGQPIVWQFGMIADACSSIVMTLPARNVTVILLANSDGLAAPFGLSNGDITTSPFARLFIRLLS